MELHDYSSRLSELISQAEVTVQHGGPCDLQEGLDLALTRILDASASGRVIYLVGNGGSAAVAAHMQNDLMGAVGVRALVFNDPSLMTALTNDHGYPRVFELPLMRWAEPGDVLVAISSSGASENIVAAARLAREAGSAVISFTGFRPDNPLREVGDLNFYVASDHYGMVELAHGCLCHYITDAGVEHERKQMERAAAKQRAAQREAQAGPQACPQRGLHGEAHGRATHR